MDSYYPPNQPQSAATQTVTASPTPGGSNKKTLSVMVAVVAIIILLGAGYIFQSQREEVTKIDQGSLARAKEGRVVSGFPSEFVLEPEAAVIESYRVNFDQTENQQYVRTYISNKSLGENIALYEAWFEKGGWTNSFSSVTDTNGEKISIFYAHKEKPSVDINVTFVPEDGKTKVIAAYSTYTD